MGVGGREECAMDLRLTFCAWIWVCFPIGVSFADFYPIAQLRSRGVSQGGRSLEAAGRGRGRICRPNLPAPPFQAPPRPRLLACVGVCVCVHAVFVCKGPGRGGRCVCVCAHEGCCRRVCVCRGGPRVQCTCLCTRWWPQRPGRWLSRRRGFQKAGGPPRCRLEV